MLLPTFDALCRAAPHRPAVVAGARQLTYGALHAQSSRLAGFLLHEAAVAPGALVAVYLPRTVDVLTGMLGAMQSGAAYTVVEDDGQHAEHHHRLQEMAPAVVLCEEGQVAPLRRLGLRAFDCAAALAWDGATTLPVAAPADIAYVLFTSGSTGKPKGVAVTHGNVAHYTGAIAARLGVAAPLRYAHVSTLAADLGNTSLFLALSTGGCLHLLGSELRRDPGALRDYLIGHGIEFLKMTPSHWNAIFASMTPAHIARLQLQHLVLGGEALPVGLARRILQSGVARLLSNHYGPTETTVGVTAYPLTAPDQLDAIATGSVPIGLPLGETVLRVRTDSGAFLDKHATGELYIGGPSVAAGYVNDPVNTASRFVLLGSEGRFYQTGDHVTIDEHGVVQFHGRIDRQVKINGYRVELGHVESVLRSTQGLADAAVFFPEIDGKARLVAAFTSQDGAPDMAQLRAQLADVLPEYMVPKRFVRMAAFPRNANGKTDLKQLECQVLARLADIGPAPAPAPAPAHPSALDALRAMWQTCLRNTAFGDDDNFFDLGGDSLDAIALIAQLQVEGHPVTARAFLQRPTINGLLQACTEGADEPDEHAAPAATDSRAFSAAQDFFFRQRLARPDHYNQAVLLECGAAVDVDCMREAVIALIEGHPSLRTAYGSDAGGRYARLAGARRADALSVSTVPGERDETATEALIEQAAEAAQATICLADGRLFHAHVFKSASGADHLLLVAHHVAVDVISWRILIADLTRLYANLQGGNPAPLPPNRHSFRDWAAHVDQHRPALQANARAWLATQADNTEGAARTVWLGCTRAETAAFTHDLPAALGAPFHVILLAAFAQVVARYRRTTRLLVDVESHGRLVCDDTIDISRVVGWHTSTYPLALPVNPHSMRETVAQVAQVASAVPDLGVAFGLAQAAAQDAIPAQVSAPVCFNYLGDVNFSHDPRCALQLAKYAHGRARAAANARGHELKFSARVRDGHLLADLSFPDSIVEHDMRTVMQALKSELMALLGRAPTPATLLTEAGTRTGLITYAPRQLLASNDAPQDQSTDRRTYRHILLTGAAGYMGVHVLMELLRQSPARVVCIVRSKDGRSAGQRLRAAFSWYFPAMPLASFGDRVTVVEGDVAQPQLGLAPQQYEQLAASVDAVYHFAADTRLFGPEEDFRRNNVQPVQACIDFAQHRRPKDLHYMSTLAVCGVNPRPEPIVYAEDALDVGQEFQNYYESSKRDAERLVQRFRMTGQAGFIYRAGNVTAHSRSARFQRNADDNRFVQFLAACVKLGQLPQDCGEAMVLSPVDEVAAGIVAISLHPALQGGTFHVDSPHETPVRHVFDALMHIGVPLVQSRHPTFASLFRALGDNTDPALALGTFWAMRKPRNVRYSHARTHDLLHELGRSFRRLDAAWMREFVRNLVEQGVFGQIAPLQLQA